MIDFHVGGEQTMTSELKIRCTILKMPSAFTLPELYNKLGVSEYGEASERILVLKVLDELMNDALVDFADLDNESIVAYRSVFADDETETTRNVGKDYAACDQFVCEKCGIELQGWKKVERDPDDGEEYHCEYIFKRCPECGAIIVEEE